MTKIFQENARNYLDKGISVMPLAPRTKIPVTKVWQDFCHTLPPEELVERWMASSDDYNIGVCCGPQSRFIALDIDYADDATINLIEKICPSSPYIRVGKKGKVIGFKYNGEKPTKYKTADGKTICELLSAGNQMCLEGSIHPETGKPYQSTAPLWKVVDSLPILPPHFEEILRTALEDHLGQPLSQKGRMRVTDFVSSGARDTAMTSFAGILALSILRGENSLKEAIGMMYQWCDTQTEKVVGDEVKVESGVSNIINFMFRHVDRDHKILPKGWDDGLTDADKEKLGLNNREEDTAMTEEELRSLVKTCFETTEEGSKERNDAVGVIIRKLVLSDLSTLSEDRLIRFISQSDRNLSVPSIRKAIREMRSTGIEGNNHSEIARAALKDLNDLHMKPSDEFKNDGAVDTFEYLRFTNDKFYEWSGSYWKELPEDAILKHLSENYGKLNAAKRNSDLKGILQIMKTLVGHDLAKNGSAKSRFGLNMANGFVTEDGEILPHNRDFGCTYCLPFSYRPELADLHDAPLFSSFLYSSWGKEADFAERVRCLQEMIGATLFGLATSFSRAFLLFGLGGSGKSQLLTIIRSLFPPEALSFVTPYNFADKFAVTNLSQSLLNVAGELSDTTNIPGDSFKSITSGEPQVGQYKGRPLFPFSPKAAHWFASNHLPKSKDVTSGFFRRWLVLSFNHVVAQEDIVLNLGERIAAEERESIVAWAAASIKDLKANKDYHLPPSHFDKVVSMAEDSDSVFFWLSSGGPSSPKLAEGETTLIPALYEKYSGACYSELSQKPVGQRKFFTRLRELSLTSKLFSVSTSHVAGLTLDSGKGSPICIEKV